MGILLAQPVGATGFNNSASPRNQSLTNPIAANNFILVAVSCFTGSPLALQCNDNLGNQFFPLFTGFQTGPAQYLTVFWAWVENPGALTVTMTPSTSVFMGLAVHEYSGVSLISPIDSWCNRRQAASSSATAGIVSVPRNGDAVFACFTQSAGIVSGAAGSGFTLRANLNNSSTAMSLFTMDNLNCNSDTDTPFTFASPVTYDGIAISLRAAYTPVGHIKAVPGQATGIQRAGFSNLPLDVPFPLPTTTGNFAIAHVSTRTNSAGLLFTTVKDNKGNIWTLASGQQNATFGIRTEIWYSSNFNGGPGHVITAIPISPVNLNVAINEYTGPAALNLIQTAFGVSDTPDSGTIAAPAISLVVGGMAEIGTIGSTAAYQHGVAVERDWTNVVTMPGDDVAGTMTSSFQTLGDVTDFGGGNIDATWKFVDSNAWVAAGSAFTTAQQLECRFLSLDELNALIGLGYTLVSGPFNDPDTCTINCAGVASSSIVSSASSVASSLLVSSSQKISSSSPKVSSVVSSSVKSSASSPPASSPSSFASAVSSASPKSSSSSKTSSITVASSSSVKASSSSVVTASSAKSSSKSSVTLVSSKSFSAQSSDSSFGNLAPACQNQTCVNDPHYNNDPTAGPLGIRWPIKTYLQISNYTPDANCPYVQNLQVIPVNWDVNIPSTFIPGANGAWISDVYTGNGQITALNAAGLPSQIYGDFNRSSPVNCPPIRFMVSCGNGFAPDMYLWIFYADESQQFDIFSPLAFDQWTSCWPLLTRVGWQPSGDQFALANFDWYQ